MSDMSTNLKTAFTVAVHGFNQTERIVLGSIFGLSARRSPKFLQHNPSQGGVPDLYLVDASDAASIQMLKSMAPQDRVPTILIGDWDHGTGWPVLARPIQWTRLFKAFDLAVAQHSAARADMPTIQIPRKTIEAAIAAADAAPQTVPQSRMAAVAPMPTPAPFSLVDSHSITQKLPPQMQRVQPEDTPSNQVPKPNLRDRSATTQQLEAIAPTATAQPMPLAPPAMHVNVPAKPVAPVVEADWALVVDDNATVREFMRTQLGPFSFNVDYAESGEQAVGMTGLKHYTCVFLDVVMPGIDGYQVCKLIKSKKGARKTAVVMLTSKSSPFDKIRGAMAGCDAYLTKPVDTDKLLTVISKFLPNG